MISKILGVFVNTFTTVEKYSVLNRDNLKQHLQMQLSQKKKSFLDFPFAFSAFRFNFEHFQEKDDNHIADIFFNLRTPKDMVR